MVPDVVRGWIKECGAADVKPALADLVARHGHEFVNVQMLLLAQTPNSPNPFARGAICAAEMPDAEEPVRVWFGLYPRSVALLIGETGAGKSSLLYNLCIHAARNEPLWRVGFGLGRPLRVLYVDPENSGNFSEGHGGQCAVKIERIGQGKPRDLIFHDGQGVDLANALHIAALRQFIEAERFDVVVLDPIANLFGTKDENDNAEAARQMTALTALSRATGACILAVHHTGKNSTGDYGRGASARLGAADVAFMFRAKGDVDEVDDTFDGELRQREDQCRLQIVKNRIQGRGSLYLRMAGEDRFAPSTFESWKSARARADGAATKVQMAEEEIKLYLSDGLWHGRAEMVEALRKEDLGRNVVDAALECLVSAELVISQRKGKGGSLLYLLASFAGDGVVKADSAESFPVSPSLKEIGKAGKFEGSAEGAGPGDDGDLWAVLGVPSGSVGQPEETREEDADDGDPFTR